MTFNTSCLSIKTHTHHHVYLHVYYWLWPLIRVLLLPFSLFVLSSIYLWRRRSHHHVSITVFLKSKLFTTNFNITYLHLNTWNASLEFEWSWSFEEIPVISARYWIFFACEMTMPWVLCVIAPEKGNFDFPHWHQRRWRWRWRFGRRLWFNCRRSQTIDT